MVQRNYLEKMGKKSLNVEIDRNSGFCRGVVLAINRAEKVLAEKGSLYSLGAIVHNNIELSRLEKMGMKVTDHAGAERLRNTTLLIRAHGEPPSTYDMARKNNLDIIDCTCSVVLQLQKKIRESHEKLKPNKGTLLIFGKKGHAEVNGLVGQAYGDAEVIEKKEDLDSIDYTRPVVLFSQTTKNPHEYNEIISMILRKVKEAGGDTASFTAHDTICRQVSSRKSHLEKFAASHDIIIFVSGSESSNGKMLFATCKSANPRSYEIENIFQIDTSWFKEGDFAGVCGATSTPKWLLEKTVAFIKDI